MENKLLGKNKRPDWWKWFSKVSTRNIKMSNIKGVSNEQKELI